MEPGNQQPARELVGMTTRRDSLGEGQGRGLADEPDRVFIRRLLLTLLIGALVALLWYLSDLVLLLFGSVLVAVMLRAIADPIHRTTGIPPSLSLLLAGLLVLAVLTSGVVLFGAQIGEQMGSLVQRLPSALSRLAGEFEINSILDMLKNSGTASSLGSLFERLFSWSTTLIAGTASLLVVIVGGIYLATDPTLYRDGFLKLVPPAAKANVSATLDDCSQALRLWLAGQLAAMVIVGVLTTIGLLLVGVPSALALGFIAGLAEFVPYVGPIASAIPAIIVASSQDWSTVGWTIGVYVVVQQLENNLIIPLLARQTVSIAPAIGIFAIIAIGLLLGPLGLLLAFPLVVVIDVAVRRLYVLDTLEENVEILGEPGVPSEETPAGRASEST